MSSLQGSINLPSIHDSSIPSTEKPPIQILQGKWYITHTTLPYFRDKRNLQVDYTHIPSDKPATPPTIDDLLTYETLALPVRKAIHGTDTVLQAGLGKYRWRGNGWLRIVSSHWEILGSGSSGGAQGELATQDSAGLAGTRVFDMEAGQTFNKWMVIYAEKTMFSPAGLSISPQAEKGLPDEVYSEIITVLRTLARQRQDSAQDFVALVQSIYAARRS